MYTGKLQSGGIDRKIAEFIAKMNALGLTPLIDISEEAALIAFSEKEFLASMKRHLIKSGIPENKIAIEVVPLSDDRYIKITVRRK
jgi:hypothetical protein